MIILTREGTKDCLIYGVGKVPIFTMNLPLCESKSFAYDLRQDEIEYYDNSL